MLARFVTFVYVNRDAMGGVYDFLKDTGYDVWLNPRGNDARKFSIGEKTVVIRPTITRERSSGHVADIQAFLMMSSAELPTTIKAEAVDSLSVDIL